MLDLYDINIFELAIACVITIGIYAIWEDSNR